MADEALLDHMVLRYVETLQAMLLLLPGDRGQGVSVVSAPDPNLPKRRSLPDTGSDPRWGWFGSGAETRGSICVYTGTYQQ